MVAHDYVNGHEATNLGRRFPNFLLVLDVCPKYSHQSRCMGRDWMLDLHLLSIDCTPQAARRGSLATQKMGGRSNR